MGLPLADLGSVIEAGSTIAYAGTCAGGKIHWSVSGTVPSRFLPRRQADAAQRRGNRNGRISTVGLAADSKDAIAHSAVREGQQRHGDENPGRRKELRGADL